jgi:transposase, IS5 family
MAYMECGRPGRNPLHESIERAAGTACGPQGGLHLTQPSRLLRTDKVRADTTVVEGDVGYPTDSGLLANGIGAMCRSVARIKTLGAASRTRARDRRRSAGRRARCIASKLRLRGQQQRDQAQAAVRRITGELAGIAEAATRDAARVIRNARRALRTATGTRRGRLHQAIDHLESMVGRTQQVVAQTRSRLAGVMPESASRVVSLHDVDARPIRKGRLGKPVEFGYKAQVVDNADAVILDTPSRVETLLMHRNWRQRSSGSLAAPAAHHGR